MERILNLRCVVLDNPTHVANRSLLEEMGKLALLDWNPGYFVVRHSYVLGGLDAE